MSYKIQNKHKNKLLTHLFCHDDVDIEQGVLFGELRQPSGLQLLPVLFGRQGQLGAGNLGEFDDEGGALVHREPVAAYYRLDRSYYVARRGVEVGRVPSTGFLSILVDMRY